MRSLSQAGRRAVPAANAGMRIKAPRCLENWLQPLRLAYPTRMNKQIVLPYPTGTQGGGIGFHLPVDPLLSSGPSLPR